MVMQGAVDVLLEPRPLSNFVETPFVESIVDRAMTYIAAGFPIHFRGASGTGKTTLALHVASKVGRPVVMLHGDEEFNTSDLVGGEYGYRMRKVIDNFIHSVLKTEEDIIYGVKTIVSNGIGIAAISRGREGMVIADKNMVLKVVPPDVKVMSTVGAGDSTVAGLVFKLSQGGSLEDASRLAVAAGTAATLTSGTELCHKADVERLLPQVKIEKLLY